MVELSDGEVISAFGAAYAALVAAVGYLYRQERKCQKRVTDVIKALRDLAAVADDDDDPPPTPAPFRRRRHPSGRHRRLRVAGEKDDQ